jgi:DNA-binding SARP family transcriptional activator
MRISMKLLGVLEVTVDGQAIRPEHWRLRHPRQLVELLALQPQQRIEREHLLDLLWPHAERDAATNRLHHTLHLLRNIFGSVGVTRNVPVVTLQGALVCFGDGHDYSLDVCDFRSSIGQARRLLPSRGGQTHLERAIELYAGEVLVGDLQEDWLVQCREECRNEHHWALDQLAALRRAAGDAEGASLLYQKIVDADPANELAHRALMDLFAAMGRPERAVRQFHVCKRQLERELDVEPSPATHRLLESVAAQMRAAPMLQADRVHKPVTAPLDESPVRARYTPPPHAAPLLGRDSELTTLTALLRQGQERLITITGTAGIGKTRLAQTLAQQCQDHLAHGVVFVELTACADRQQVVEQVARALGLNIGARDLARSVGDALACRHTLLVLDRFEHLLHEAPLLDDWLSAAPGLRLVVTSRVPLHRAAERHFELDNLLARTDEPALALFNFSAANVGVAVDLTREAAVVAAICRRLEGNALAIQVAASQLQLLTLTQLETQLARPLDLLHNPLRDADRMHSSLQRTLEWTLELLPRRAQALFSMLGVFADRFTLRDAQTVLAPFASPQAVEADLSLLLQWHLLARFSGGNDSCGQAAVLGFLDMPKQLAHSHAARLPEWPGLVQQLGSHVAARCEAAAKLKNSHFGRCWGLFQPVLADVRRLLTDDALPTTAAHRCQIAFQAGAIRLYSGNSTEALAWMERAAKLCRPSDSTHFAWLHGVMVSVYGSLGRHRLAVRAARTALQLERTTHPDTLLASNVKRMRIIEWGHMGRLVAAERGMCRLVAEAERSGSTAALPTFEYSALARLQALRGEWHAATATAERCLALAAQDDNPRVLAYERLTLSQIALAQGELDLARAQLAEARRVPAHDYTGDVLSALVIREAEVAIEAAEPHAAAELLLPLVEQGAAACYAPHHAAALALLDCIALDRGTSQPLRCLDQPHADRMAFDTATADVFVRSHCALLVLHTRTGRTSSAAASLRHLRRLAAMQVGHAWRDQMALACCEVALLRDDPAAAARLLTGVQQRMAASGHPATPRRRHELERLRRAVEAALASRQPIDLPGLTRLPALRPPALAAVSPAPAHA